MNSARIAIGNGWFLNVTTGPVDSWLIVNGPLGEGAAFNCEPGSVRDEVLHALATGAAFVPNPEAAK